MGLEFGEGHFDRVEVRAVRRQEQEPSSTLLKERLGFCAFVAGEVVQDHNVARMQCWGELGLDVGVEDLTVALSRCGAKNARKPVLRLSLGDRGAPSIQRRGTEVAVGRC